MRFYVCQPDGGLFAPQWAYGQIAKPDATGDCERCPECGGAVGPLKWLPPHRLNLSSSRREKWADFTWGAGFLVFVSARFKAIYEAEGLTGITIFHPPAEIVRLGTKKAADVPPPLPVYHLVEVPWGGANQDDAASGVVYEKPWNIECTYCRVGVAGRRQPRVVIDETSWSGQDIFKPRNTPARFVVSERFKTVVEAHNLTNVALIPTEKYAYDEHRPGLWYVNE